MEKRRVLVIDDDVDALVLATAILGEEGYRVRCAVDIAQAIEAARSFRPEVVLLDHHLPVEPGLDAVEKLRHESSLLGAALLLVSGASFPPEAVAHLDGYVRKPWKPKDLIEAIEAAHGLALEP